MPLTLSNSNYGGEVADKIFLNLGLGNEIAEKVIAEMVTDVAGDYSMPNMEGTEKPFGVYTEEVPTTDTETITYGERKLSMAKSTIWLTFNPDNFHGTIWKKWQSVGDFTNLQMNTQFVSALLEVLMQKAGNHYSALCFQADTSLAPGTRMHYFDGWVTRAIADANVIKPDPLGDINSNNFASILAAFWQAIPNHLLFDDDFTAKVSLADWKIMQIANTELTKNFAGILGADLKDAKYLTQKMIPFEGMKQNYILGAKSDNLHAGFWMPLESESMIIDKLAPHSKKWGMRLDVKIDANYALPKEVVLYEPA